MAQVFVFDRPGEVERVTAAMLERAGQAVGIGALGGAMVLDVQVIDRDLLVFSMAIPAFDGCQVFRAVREAKPDATITAIAFGTTALTTEAAQRLSTGPHDQKEERRIWEELIALTTEVAREQDAPRAEPAAVMPAERPH